MGSTRQPRQQFQSRVRFVVSGESAIYEALAANLSPGGMFVRHDRPPPVGSMVLLEFVLPDDQPLCRITARVVLARPASTPGEATAGMGLQFMHLDDRARTALMAGRANEALRDSDVDQAPVEHSVTTNLPPPPTSVDQPAEGSVIGIDLGTVNSCVAIVENGVPRVITSPEGYETIPSVLYYGADEKLLVGHRAVEKMILEPTRAIYGSKRFLGRPFASKEVRTWGHFFHYKLVEGFEGRTAAQMGNTILPLEEVSAYILFAMRQMAATALGRPVNRAVITVPAYFGTAQRESVREAGRLAGLHVERVLNEPTAAAIAYGHGRGLKRTTMVYDLGGGTFDVSIMKVDANRFEVIAVDGDPFLGGSDFDDRLMEYALTLFERTNQVDVRSNPVAVQRVRFAARLAKHQLTDAESTVLEVPFLGKGPSGMLDLSVRLDRRLFFSLTQDLVDRTISIAASLLSMLDMSSSELDDIVIVGGQSRSQHVRRTLLERFGRKPSASVHTDQAVALGAALVASTLTDARSSLQLVDLLPGRLTLGLPDGRVTELVPRGAQLPVASEVQVDATAAEIRFPLYRGEQATTAENSFLGALHAPQGVPPAVRHPRATLRVSISAECLLSAVLINPDTQDDVRLVVSSRER